MLFDVLWHLPDHREQASLAAGNKDAADGAFGNGRLLVDRATWCDRVPHRRRVWQVLGRNNLGFLESSVEALLYMDVVRRNLGNEFRELRGQRDWDWPFHAVRLERPQGKCQEEALGEATNRATIPRVSGVVLCTLEHDTDERTLIGAPHTDEFTTFCRIR